ncbi:MAG: hypothetical protein EBQ52_02645 [Synechococcaceae bacterium LLD_019]|nr:hypothetical protein [Synechococcaceae bacterium WB6_3A_227]NBR44854.1 hypothetical protein [Synechococcaceae bacterium WB5_2B_268]NBY59064.1 hypothetical protein [Synechococcaceae bacterium LLD_019]NCU76129.1 hypothetical protein [Synechococcaceae bacterium WB7_1C_051]NDA74512.1 hypothetical protein [Synechococcaceae bacterium WB8_3_299]NDD21753.1 hypothetical protein [Synechococcaceae bacterium WBA_3_309]NDE21339.1 hypothetical protein [Synechococcaceae bacterium WB9_3_282]NDG00188.1 hy
MDNSPAPARWLSWRSGLYLYVGLVVLDIWMLLVTPTLSPWHWVGFAGFVIMPLALVAMRQAGNHENTNIQPILLAFMGFAGYANTIFIPSIKEWFFTSTWGVGNYYVPSRMVYPMGYAINSEHMITVHAASALLLAGLITYQWITMLRKRRLAEMVKLHRLIGSFTAFIVLPVMVASGILSAIYVLKTPFNQVTYAALPIIIAGCLIASIRSAIAGNLTQHVDYGYSAFIVLCSAALYRFACLFIWLDRGSYTTATQAPVDGAAILTYLILMGFIIIPFAVLGRLKQNIFPVITLASVLILSMIFVPWQFFGAPASANFLSHLKLV